MMSLFKSFLKFAVIGVLIQVAFAIVLDGHDPLDDVSSRLDAPNWFGYWIFMPFLFGVVLACLSALWDFVASKLSRKGRGQWPKP